MNEEWKRFLLQWILPVAIFIVAMSFVFGSFKADLVREATTEHVSSLVSATEDYAANIHSSLQKSESVTNAVSELFSVSDISDAEKAVGLDAVVKHSDAYMTVECSKNGDGINNLGEHVNIASKDYYADVLGDDIYDYHFVTDDGFDNGAAIIFTIDNPENNRFILVYYPINFASLKKMVTVERDYDSAAYSFITNADGTVLVSTNQSYGYVAGSDVWEALLKENAEASIRRVKTKLQSGNSGYFEARAINIPSLITYAPIPGTDKVLMICFNQKNSEKNVAKMTQDSIKELTLVTVLIALFILVITIINIAQIFVNNRSKEDLQEKADNDQLTGLKNKIATEREIKEYMENFPNSIGMLFLIDIDNFKKINDTMGHAFGDEVLREIGRNIGVNFRVSDVIGRVGGDEFMVFLKNLKEDANTIREAQKLSYFFKHFQVGDYVKYSVTASIGAAVFPAHGSDFASLYKSADAAVYKSKKRGKAQLSFYDDRDKTPEEVAEADAHQISIERKTETPIES